jgi:hypothetical protein
MLEPNQHLISLGDLKYGQPYSFKYSIKNTSQNPVTINRVMVGCGSCTTANIQKSLISPGEESDLDVVFTPGSTGLQQKGITIQYDDNNSITLKFTATVNE